MAVITLTGRRQRRFAFHCSSAVCDHERQALNFAVSTLAKRKQRLNCNCFESISRWRTDHNLLPFVVSSDFSSVLRTAWKVKASWILSQRHFSTNWPQVRYACSKEQKRSTIKYWYAWSKDQKRSTRPWSCGDLDCDVAFQQFCSLQVKYACSKEQKRSTDKYYCTWSKDQKRSSRTRPCSDLQIGIVYFWECSADGEVMLWLGGDTSEEDLLQCNANKLKVYPLNYVGDYSDRTSATPFRIQLLFCSLWPRETSSQFRFQRWLKENKGSTATALNPIADDGQTTTCFVLLCHQTSPVFREQRGKSSQVDTTITSFFNKS